jgi:hypothetical protein
MRQGNRPLTIITKLALSLYVNVALMKNALNFRNFPLPNGEFNLVLGKGIILYALLVEADKFEFLTKIRKSRF